MATKYVRTGGGNFADDATWSTTSGGGADTTAPTAADDGRPDANSGQLTIAATAACNSFVCTGYTNTLTWNAGITMTCSGDFTLVVGMTCAIDPTATLVFAASALLTSAGKSIGNLTCATAAVTVTCQDATNCTNFTNTNGAIDIGDFTCTVRGNLDISGSATFSQTDVGTAYMILTGPGKTIQTTLGTYNPRRVTVTGTYTAAGTVQIGKTTSGYGQLVVDGGTLALGANGWYFYLNPTNPISVVNGGTVTGTLDWSWYIRADTTLGAFSSVGSGALQFWGAYTYTLGGELNVPNKTLLNFGTSRLNTATYNLTALKLQLGNAELPFLVNLGSGAHAFGSIGPSGTTTANTLDLGSSTTTVTGNVNLTNITVTPGTGTLIFAASGLLTSAGNQIGNLTCATAGVIVTCQDALNCLNFTNTNGQIAIADFTTTVRGNLDISSSATFTQTDAGTAYMILSGTGKTISTPLSTYNPRRVTVTGTYTAVSNVAIGKAPTAGNALGQLIVNGGTLALGANTFFVNVNPTNCISIISGGTLTGTGDWFWALGANTTVPGFSTTASGYLFWQSNGYTTALGGNWSTPNKTVENYGASTGLDTATYNLSVLALQLGQDTFPFLVNLGSGAHAIGRIWPGGTTTTNTLNLGSSVTTVSGNIDLTNITVTPATGTLALSGGASAQTLTGAGKTVYDIRITPGAGLLTLGSAFTFHDMTMSAPGEKPIKGTSGQTYTMTGTSFLSGTLGGVITIASTTQGSPFHLTKTSGIVICDFLSLQDCHAEGGAQWLAGSLTNSIDVSGNNGWLFRTPLNPVERAAGYGQMLLVGAAERSAGYAQWLAGTAERPAGYTQRMALANAERTAGFVQRVALAENERTAGYAQWLALLEELTAGYTQQTALADAEWSGGYAQCLALVALMYTAGYSQNRVRGIPATFIAVDVE